MLIDIFHLNMSICIMLTTGLFGSFVVSVPEDSHSQEPNLGRCNFMALVKICRLKHVETVDLKIWITWTKFLIVCRIM